MNLFASLLDRGQESHPAMSQTAVSKPVLPSGPRVPRLRLLPILMSAVVILLMLGACSPISPDPEQAATTEPAPEETVDETVDETDAAPSALSALPGTATDETYRGLPVGFTEDGRLFRGDLDAPLVMIEFSDFQCPFCNRYFVQTEPALDEAYVRTGDLLVIFHDFPLEQLHPIAPLAHEALLCVGEQGSATTAWELRGELFRSTSEWGNMSDPTPVFSRLADEIGADVDAFDACMDDGTYGEEVAARVEHAVAQGFSGTPSFQFVRRNDGGIFQLVGAQPFDEFSGLIDALLAGQTPQTAQPDTQPPEDEGPPFWATREGLQPDPDRPGYTLSGDIYRGNPDAAVAVIEFSDFQCPFCRRHVEETQPTLDELYVDTGEVMWVFKHFPLNIHPQAPMAGAAAECAADQDLFWEMHHLLFETVEQWAVNDPAAALLTIAQELDGLEMSAFEACMAGDEALARVESDMEDGAPYVRGTPTFIVLHNDEGSIIPGALPLETFVEVMDEVLAEAQ